MYISAYQIADVLITTCIWSVLLWLSSFSLINNDIANSISVVIMFGWSILMVIAMADDHCRFKPDYSIIVSSIKYATITDCVVVLSVWSLITLLAAIF